MNLLFTKKFLDELQEKADEISLVDWIMRHHEVSFREAIIIIAKELDMTPEWVVKKNQEEREAKKC